MRPTTTADRPASAAALVAVATLSVALAACADATTAVSGPASGTVATESEGRGAFHRYVAIGTSVSMGWRSDGVDAASQESSWPAQLARLAGHELSVPAIAAPGCGAPLLAPLASGLRVSGESAAAPFLSRSCAPNVAGVTLPAGNVAVNGARTIHALTATPESPDPSYAPLYARVLPPGMSQVAAMMAQNPKVVSVELGANELLGARNGVYLPGVSVVPVSTWEPQYLAVLDSVEKVAQLGVLVGLIDDARSFPSFRSGAELWNARATFAPLNVSVAADCEGSPNVLFVAVRVPVAAAEGAQRARAGQGPATLSCANAPSATGVQDYVLAPDDVAALNAQLAAMNAIVRREAARRGWAYFALSALYEQAVVKGAFNAVALMTAQQPYGPLVSLDGFHPTAEGAATLARAAATSLNARYGLGIPTAPTVALARP